MSAPPPPSDSGTDPPDRGTPLVDSGGSDSCKVASFDGPERTKTHTPGAPPTSEPDGSPPNGSGKTADLTVMSPPPGTEAESCKVASFDGPERTKPRPPGSASPTSEGSQTSKTRDKTSGRKAASQKESPSSDGRRKESAEYQRQKEERRLAFELKTKQVRLALWPTPESIASMEKFIGGPIRYERLFDSLTFKDRWATFCKKRHPSGTDLEIIRSEANRILLRGTQHRGNKKQPSSARSPPAAPSRGSSSATRSEKGTLKRARDPSSSSTSSEASTSTATKPLAKNSRANGTTPSPSRSKTTQGPATTDPPLATDNSFVPPADVEMHEDDVVEDEDAEPPLSSFTADMQSALGYAEAAKGEKPKEQFLLYIHQGERLREKISRERWRLFLEKFNILMFDQAVKGQDVPKVNWSGFSSGTGIITPTDEDSVAKVVSLVGQIEVAGTKFKAWRRGDEGSCTLITLKLPASLSGIQANKVVAGIIKMNNLPGDEFTLRKSAELPGSKERVLRIIVTHECFKALKEVHHGRLFAGANRLDVYSKRSKLT